MSLASPASLPDDEMDDAPNEVQYDAADSGLATKGQDSSWNAQWTREEEVLLLEVLDQTQDLDEICEVGLNCVFI